MAQQTAPTSATKSDVIAGLDASPFQRFQAGQGGAGRVVIANAVASIASTQATTVATRLIRLPSNAIIKKVELVIEAGGGTITTLTGALGLLWSDNANDGTPATYVGSLTPASSACFASALAMAGFTAMTDVTYKNVTGNSVTDGFYVPSASEMPIWLALTQGGPSPQTPGAWAGFGAVTLSTNALYQLSADPGGFFDLFFQATTTTSLSAAMNVTTQLTYVTT